MNECTLYLISNKVTIFFNINNIYKFGSLFEKNHQLKSRMCITQVFKLVIYICKQQTSSVANYDSNLFIKLQLQIEN